jgi:hypothetical protein
MAQLYIIPCCIISKSSTGEASGLMVFVQVQHSERSLHSIIYIQCIYFTNLCTASANSFAICLPSSQIQSCPPFKSLTSRTLLPS